MFGLVPSLKSVPRAKYTYFSSHSNSAFLPISVGDTDPIAPISVEDAEPTNSGSEEAVAQSVELLKTAARTRKVSASEIIAAFKVLDKAKLDPTDFLSLVGGTKSPGRTWLLIFNSSIQAVLHSSHSSVY